MARSYFLILVFFCTIRISVILHEVAGSRKAIDSATPRRMTAGAGITELKHSSCRCKTAPRNSQK